MLLFCTVYYILSYCQCIPQIIKLLKTKSSNDYSLGTLLLQFISMLSWSIYIFTSEQSLLVYIGTIIDLILLIIIDLLILIFYKFN